MTAPRHPNYRSPASLPAELRRTSVPHAVRQWARDELGEAVERVSRLPGASSTAVHRLDLAGGGRVVLRRYVWPGFVAEDPAAPQREVDALALAATLGVPAPVVLAADVDGSHIGDGIPAVIMTFLWGRARAVPDLRSLAAAAAAIHGVDASDFPHRYYRWYEGVVTVPPAGATDPARWERAIEIWHASMPRYRPGFLHRDFHPGNVLWTRGTLTGVVDWPNACAGPWGCDIAHCRDNLLQLGGPDAADAFLAAYLDLTGESYDPYWEIASVLEHSPSGFDSERIAISEARLGPAVAAYSA